MPHFFNPPEARGGNKLPSRAAGWGMEQTGLKRGLAARLNKHNIRDNFFQWMALDGVFYLPLHHTTCIFSLPVRGGPATHLLGRPTYRNQHSIFLSSPKNNAVLCLFWGRKHYGRAWAGEKGRQSNKKIKKSWCAVATLTKQVQFFSGRRCAVDTHTSQSHSRHTNKFTHKYNRKGKHSYQTQVHRTCSYS